jgi:adenylate cyclase
MDVINPDRCDTTSVTEWLIGGARSSPEAGGVLAELCGRLVACGVPLWRVAVLVRTLHPDVVGRRFLWQLGREIEMFMAPYEVLETPEYRASPFARVLRTGVPVRRRLADADCALDFPILADLRAEGVTDYLVTPLIFTDDSIHIATWSTRQPGGFTDVQMAGLEAVITPLARVAEVRALQRTAANLLQTYVGHKAGERILHGQIRRGHTEAIHAAIWLSDMRGFTASADRLPLEMLIDLLNRYFDCQVPPILEAGGEVLKFMGDGLLAIFPIDGGDAGPVCERAFAAALDARDRIAALTCRARRRRRRPVRPRAARRPGALRQHRRRQPARLHLHRTGSQSGGTDGKGRRQARPGNRRVERFRRSLLGRARADRGVRGRGLQRAADGVRTSGIRGQGSVVRKQFF